MAYKSVHSGFRISAVAVALLGVYGVAGADPASNTLLCRNSVCAPAPGTAFEGVSTTPTYYDWIVKAENSDLTLTGGSVKGTGHKTRGVGSTAGSTVTLDGVTVTTHTGGGTNWGSHGVQADESGSKLIMNGGSISTTGKYSNGIQAGAGGIVTGTGVTITADGEDSYTFGVEANNGGEISLEGGSIDVKGKNAGGVRTYTGDGKTAKGLVELVGTNVNVTGESVIGLMAGDKDTIATSAGDISFKNATASANGTNAIAARAIAGGVLTIDNATFTSSTASGDATGVFVDGPGSALNATNLTIRSTGSARAKGVVAENGGKATIVGGTIETMGGMNSHAMDAFQTGSVITATDVDVKTTGYAAGAFNGAEVVLTRGTYDVVGTTATTGWDTAAGFVVGGSAANSKLTAQNVKLINSAPLLNAPPTYTSSALRVGADFGTALNSQAEMSLTNSEVIASGSQRRIALIENNSHLIATNSHLSSEQDEGIALVNNAKLTLDGTTVEAKKESLRSHFSTADAEQVIDINGSSVLSKNNGTLLLVERSGAGANGVVALTVNSGAYVFGNIENRDAAGQLVAHDGTKTKVDIKSGANWAGMVVDTSTAIVEAGQSRDYVGPALGDTAGSQGSTINFTGTTQTLTGSLSSGPGSTVNSTGSLTVSDQVLGQPGATLNFSGPSTTIGGGVTSVGSSFQFSGPTTIINNGLAGSGSNFVFGGGSTTITGNVQLDDNSTIQGGTTGAPIAINGSVAVNSGATLGGNLNVSGALTGTNGILGPGNSTGIQTYGSLGDFTGTYIAEVNASGKSDLIKIATGDADLSTIALRVRQENGNGGYVLNHDYTILQTLTGEVKNTFAGTPSLDDSFANALVKLDPVKYGAKDVKISLVADTAKVAAARPGLSGNQNAVLDGVLSVAGQNTAADAVMQMGSAEERNNALNQLSGEVHGSTQSALHSSGGLLISTIGNRMRGNVGAGMLAGAPTADASGSAVAGSMPRSAAYPLWAEVVGNWNTLDGDDNAAETKSHTAGIYVGGDTAVGNGWRVGGALGFTDGRIKADSVGSRSDVRSYTATVYGGNQWAAGNGQVNFLAGAGYTRHNIDSRRSINVGGSQTLKADYHANTVQLFTELGYAIPVGQVSTIEPYAGVAWSSQRTKDFTETGGSAALHGKGQTDDVTTLTLGLRGTTLMAVGQHDARLSAGLGWRHASGDVNANRTMSFVQGGGAAFTVAGAPIAKNAAVVDVGAEVDVGKNAAMGLAYSGQFGNGSTDSTGSLYLKVRF